MDKNKEQKGIHMERSIEDGDLSETTIKKLTSKVLMDLPSFCEGCRENLFKKKNGK